MPQDEGKQGVDLWEAEQGQNGGVFLVLRHADGRLAGVPNSREPAYIWAGKAAQPMADYLNEAASLRQRLEVAEKKAALADKFREGALVNVPRGLECVFCGCLAIGSEPVHAEDDECPVALYDSLTAGES